MAAFICPHCGASASGTMAETWAWDKKHRTECTERPTP